MTDDIIPPLTVEQRRARQRAYTAAHRARQRARGRTAAEILLSAAALAALDELAATRGLSRSAMLEMLIRDAAG